MMRIREEVEGFWDLFAIRYACALIGSLIWLLLAAISFGGQPTCHPSHADSTAIWYVPAGENTAVKLIARCGGIETAWYVSFFEGEQPDLWTYAEIQNTAGRLLRGG